ncbi:MAG: hypothetical protein HUK02_08075 [Bacteroidaceae bacterium]|nr:hypothetical protein [Bacteroidaceae bacterium]
MNKIKIFFSLLLAVVGMNVQAEPTFSNTKVYSIKNKSTNNYLLAQDGKLWTSAKAGIPYSANDPRFQWVIFNDETGVFLYNIGQGGWVNNTTNAPSQGNHWVIETSGTLSYIDFLADGEYVSLRDADHTSSGSAYLHNNEGYATGITNWNPSPESPASGWLIEEIRELTAAQTADLAALQAYSASVSGIIPVIDALRAITNAEANAVGALRATDEDIANLNTYIANYQVAEAQALVNSLETISLSNNKKYILKTPRGYLNASATAASASKTDHVEWAVIQYNNTDHYYFYDTANNKFLGTANLNSVDTPDWYYNVAPWGNNPCEFKITNKSNTNNGKLLQMDGTPTLTTTSGWTIKDNGNVWTICEADDYTIPQNVMDAISLYENQANVTVLHKYGNTVLNTENFKLDTSKSEARTWQPTPFIPANRVGVENDITTHDITGDTEITVNYTCAESALPFATSDLSAGFKNDTKFYTMKIRGNKNVVYSTADNYAKNDQAEPGLTAGKYFAFTGDNITGFKIYNLEAGKDKAFGNDKTFKAAGQLLYLENNDNAYFFIEAGSTTNYINDNNSTLGYWNTSAAKTDGGGKIQFIEAAEEDLLNSAKQTFLGGVGATQTSGQIGDYTQAYIDVVKPIAELNDLEAVLTYEGEHAPDAEYILPTPNAFYAIKDYRYNTYADGSSFPVANKVSHTTAEAGLSASQIWYFDNEMKGYCLGTGYGIKNCTEKAGIDDAQVFTFEIKDVTKIPATFAVRVPNNNINSYWYVWNTGSEKYGSIDRNGATYTANNCQFYIEKVTTLPITIGETGYASLNLPVATTIPAGVEAWYASATAVDGVIALKKITDDILPANCAVILYTATPNTYDFTITTGGTATSDFSGTIAAELKPATGTTYVLGKVNDAVGLYEYTGTSLPGFKMYYHDATGGNIRLQFDEITTAISAAKDNTLREGVMYNLSGQRVTKANGIVIVNGKKLVVK